MARSVLVCESFRQYPSGSALWMKRGWSWPITTRSVPALANRYAMDGLNIRLYFAASPRLVGGFRVWQTAPGIASLFSLLYINNSHLAVATSGDGSITVTRAGTALAPSAAGLFKFGTWNTVLFDLYIHDTVGFLKVVVNGTTVADVSGVDTKSGAYTTADNLAVQNGLSYADLWIVGDDSDTTNPWSGNPALQSYAIVGDFPNADGATNDFTANGDANRYGCVDEQAMDSDTTYVEGTTLGDVQHFAFPNLPSRAIDPAIVQFTQEIRKTDVADRQVQVGVRSNGTDCPDDAVNAPDSYGIVQSKYLMDPATSPISAWTKATAQAAQSLVKVAS